MAGVEARSQRSRIALRAVAPLALMALIFYLSAQPGPDRDMALVEVVARKVGHFGGYALLTLLWSWTLRLLTPRHIAWAAVIALLYAVSDEYHQTFAPGRTGTPVDVAIDGFGVAVAAGLLRYDRRSGRRVEKTGRE